MAGEQNKQRAKMVNHRPKRIRHSNLTFAATNNSSPCETGKAYCKSHKYLPHLFVFSTILVACVIIPGAVEGSVLLMAACD